MKLLKIKAMLPIAAIMFVFVLGAAPAAMAHEFVTSQAKGVIQDKNAGNHVFETGGATVECEKEESKGVSQVKRSAENKETVVYSSCKAFGASAVVSQAKYDFNANGTVTLENEVVVKAAGPACEVKVPVAENSNLGTVTYTNNQQSGTMEVKAAVEGITATLGGSGGTCVKGTGHTGKYKGTSVVTGYGCFGKTNGVYKDMWCTEQSEPANTGSWEKQSGYIQWI